MPVCSAKAVFTNGPTVLAPPLAVVQVAVLGVAETWAEGELSPPGPVAVTT